MYIHSTYIHTCMCVLVCIHTSLNVYIPSKYVFICLSVDVLISFSQVSKSFPVLRKNHQNLVSQICFDYISEYLREILKHNDGNQRLTNDGYQCLTNDGNQWFTNDGNQCLINNGNQCLTTLIKVRKWRLGREGRGE